MTAPRLPGEGGPGPTLDELDKVASRRHWTDDLEEYNRNWERAQFWEMWRERVRLAALIVLAAGVMLLGVSAMLYVISIVDITAALVGAVLFVGGVGMLLAIITLYGLGRLSRVLEPGDDLRGGIFK